MKLRECVGAEKVRTNLEGVSATKQLFKQVNQIVTGKCRIYRPRLQRISGHVFSIRNVRFQMLSTCKNILLNSKAL